MIIFILSIIGSFILGYLFSSRIVPFARIMILTIRVYILFNKFLKELDSKGLNYEIGVKFPSEELKWDVTHGKFDNNTVRDTCERISRKYIKIL